MAPSCLPGPRASSTWTFEHEVAPNSHRQPCSRQTDWINGHKHNPVLGGTGRAGRRVLERLQGRGLPTGLGSRRRPAVRLGGPGDLGADAGASARSTCRTTRTWRSPARSRPSGRSRGSRSSAASRGWSCFPGRGEEKAELAEQAVRDSGSELAVPRFDPSSATAARRLSQMRSSLQITLAATRPHPFGEVSFSSAPARLLPRPAAVAGVFTPSEVAADRVTRREAPFRTPRARGVQRRCADRGAAGACGQPAREAPRCAQATEVRRRAGRRPAHRFGGRHISRAAARSGRSGDPPPSRPAGHGRTYRPWQKPPCTLWRATVSSRRGAISRLT